MCFQRQLDFALDAPELLKSKIHGKYKETSTPPGVAERHVWGPILFKYCPVQYSQVTKKLEIPKGNFVGKCRPTRHMIVDQELQYDSDSDNEDNKIGDIDDEDGQIPDVVVADDIFLGLCFLF